MVTATYRPLYNPPPPHPEKRPGIQCTGGWVWTGAENPLQLIIDPRIVQSVASRYTNCTIPAHDRRREES